MRLGGPIFVKCDGPQEWALAVRQLGYSAAYCPVKGDADDATVAAYRAAAKKANIVIAEVGAWSNPLSPDEPTRTRAIALCKQQLALADRLGANCCVNIVGSCGEIWDGPHPDNLTEATFDRIVQVTREIIDAVMPTHARQQSRPVDGGHACYTLETMPWMYPDSPDNYLRLVRAIDRRQCAVHLDPVNLVCSPQRYYDNAALIRECFAKLGPMIKSCHAKDILLHPKLTTHLDETAPGKGGLDYATYLRELSKLHIDTPLMIEHLKTPEEFAAAAEHIRAVAAREGVKIV